MGENFRRKVQLVADGHLTSLASPVMYSSIALCDSIRTCLILVALNDLGIRCCDIENTYLTAPLHEKCWTITGKEFGKDEGRAYAIVRALYRLKSSSVASRAHLVTQMYGKDWV